jgi:hypothetical protein
LCIVCKFILCSSCCGKLLYLAIRCILSDSLCFLAVVRGSECTVNQILNTTHLKFGANTLHVDSPLSICMTRGSTDHIVRVTRVFLISRIDAAILVLCYFSMGLLL